MAPAVRAAVRRRKESPLPVPGGLFCLLVWVGVKGVNGEVVVWGVWKYDVRMGWGLGYMIHVG